MIVVARPRAGGKTHLMLEMLRDDRDAVLVTITAMEADRLERLAAERGIYLRKGQIISFDQATGMSGLRGFATRRVLVDNADMILDRLFGHSVTAVSVTGAAL